MRRIFLLLTIVCATCCRAGDLADEFALVPHPQQIKAVSGKALRPRDLKWIEAEGTAMPVLYGMLDALPHGKRKGIGIVLQIDSTDTPSSPEGYTLRIDGRGVAIRSRGESGLFYACITLHQLLTAANDRGRDIPAMEIADFPSLDFRAVHFDTKHHLDRMEYYYSLVDRLACWKVNAVIWEIEDKLRFESHPECSAPNAISRQEMQALCRYAHDRHVEINPLVQGLGHAGFILKHHWELRENPASDWEFCPSDERYYRLQFDLYRDALEAMPYGRFLHIGGDEISEIGIDRRCCETGKTPFQLQMQWLGRVCDFVHAAGRTPIFWDDMPLKYADLWWVLHRGLSDEEVERNFKTEKLDEAIALFPKDCIYMRWHYDDPTILPHRKILDWYSHQGLRVMGATAAADGGSPFMPRYGSKAQHIGDFCRLAVRNRLEGIFATSWDDGSPHLETVVRGFAALGEFGWNVTGRSTDGFKHAHACGYWGLWDGEEAFIDSLEQAAFFFDGALVVDGRRNPAWQVVSHTLMPLPDRSSPGAWSETWQARLDSARAEVKRYETLRSAIAAAKAHATRNRYSLDIYEQLAHQFVFPAHLLLALEAYDRERTPSAREHLLSQMDSLTVVQGNLVDVYSQTRFMQQPNGYVADQNHHHHLAALTPDADWIFLYEHDFVRALRKWLE